jgi:hypothetical protein
MSLLDCWYPLTHITGARTDDLYLAEQPGGLVIPASRKERQAYQNVSKDIRRRCRIGAELFVAGVTGRP